MDVDDPEQDVEVEQPALAVLMDGVIERRLVGNGEVENPPDGNGVDTAVVEDSTGLAAQTRKAWRRYSSSTLFGSEELLPKNLTKPKPR